MTTYDFRGQRMRRRLISAGTLECSVYCEWRNKRQEVTIFTESPNKWEYLHSMGLTTSPKTRVYIKASYGGRFFPQWRFNAVRLEPVYFTEFLDWKQPYREEFEAFEDATYGERMTKVNPEDFHVLRPTVEFCIKYNINRPRLDMHSGNWLRCPITKFMYPYDVIHIPKEFE